MENTNLKLEVIRFIFLNFGKTFTFDKLAENVEGLDRITAYEVLAELVDTKHVLRTQKERNNGAKKFYVWGLDDSDEDHALEIWMTYLRDTNVQG
jgi:predicted transcriptional regulator